GDTKPLAALNVATQYENEPLKTGATRVVPVHPTLAQVLADWKRSGFEGYLGRAPRPEDFIVPSHIGRYRTRGTTLRNLQRDCGVSGITARRTHDTRHTFIS